MVQELLTPLLATSSAASFISNDSFASTNNGNYLSAAGDDHAQYRANVSDQGTQSSLCGCEETKSTRFDELKEQIETAMREVINGKFRVLVTELLETVGIVDLEKEGESWVDIVLSLAWQAALFAKTDTAQGGSSNPADYVKVKCVASGSRRESQFFKGLVITKQVPHKFMPTNFMKPRLRLIQGTVNDSGGLCSLDLMMGQMNSYRGLDTKFLELLEACQSDVVIMEKSAPFDVLEAAVERGMTLIVNMKLQNLQRIAYCTGSPILSADSLPRQKPKQCDSLCFETFVEEHAQIAENGKKPCKTLMFLEGSLSHRCCTVLLQGSSIEELKKIKHIISCAVVNAYHFIAETSFLIVQKAVFSTLFSDGVAGIQAKPCFHIDSEFHLSSSSNNASSGVPKAGAYGEYFGGRKGHIDTLLGSESIMLLMSSRNANSGVICEQRRYTRIEFYGRFDAPLGKFLRDSIFNQNGPCKTCSQATDGHRFHYGHDNKELTITVKQISGGQALPGKSEGKIWMWVGCGECTPETERNERIPKRVPLSNTARDLSFGKFLELGFSNYSRFSSLSKPGHAKHFIYYFGLGSMVASFRYSSLADYTLYVPRQMLKFETSISGDWLREETDNVHKRAMSMFKEVDRYSKEISSRFSGLTLNFNGSVKEFHDIQKILRLEESGFENNVKETWSKNSCSAHMLLCLNRLRWELLLEARIWNRRLLMMFLYGFSASLISPTCKIVWSPFPEIREKCLIELGDECQLLDSLRFDPLHSLAHLPSISEIIDEEGSRMHVSLSIADYMLSDYKGDISSIIACALAVIGFPQHKNGAHLTTTPFADESVSLPLKGKKYTVICRYGKEFRGLRNQCCPSELDYVASLSRCKILDVAGGKGGTFLAKTLDDRLIIREINKTELDSFDKFAPDYFQYMDKADSTGSPMCLARILGVYQATLRPKGGKETRCDLMVMENVFFGRTFSRKYDLKGALHGRFQIDNAGASGDFLLDQNFVHDMDICPLYVHKQTMRHLQAAVWNDTTFLSSLNVMDYSLLVGVDNERREIVYAITDYLTRYTWEKRLETWVQSIFMSAEPTCVPPKEYKKRFRKFTSNFFFVLPVSQPSRVEDRVCGSSV